MWGSAIGLLLLAVGQEVLFRQLIVSIMEIKRIYELVRQGRLAFKRHAAIRMRERRISVVAVEEALLTGKVIEDYSKSDPLPCCLILGHTTAGTPIHVVLAVDEEDERLWAITVYVPTPSEWEDNFTKRKSV